MGIYVFETKYLLRTLERDREEVDFGMHIVPRAIREDKVFAYPLNKTMPVVEFKIYSVIKLGILIPLWIDVDIGMFMDTNIKIK